MTGPYDPYQQGQGGQWGAPEGYGQPPTAPYEYPQQGYPQSEYQDDSIGRLYDGVPQGYAVPPMYPGLPGQDPNAPQKQSKPWILIASIAGAVVVVLAVVLVLIINRDSDPRQAASSPTTTVSYANPELPSGAPTYQTPTAQPPRSPISPPQVPVPPPPPPGPPMAPGQVAVVGDCIALAPPSEYKRVTCTDPKAAWRVVEVVTGGKCKPTDTGFTAGDFSYCIIPQLRVGSCYQTAVVMGSTVFVAADSCQAPKAFAVLAVIPGTTEALECKKRGAVHAFSFPNPPMAICTSEFAP